MLKYPFNVERFYPPGSLVLFGVEHGVLDGFIDQGVHVRCEGVDSRRQSLAVLGQKLLSFRVQTELHLMLHVRYIGVL